ncbi:MAG: hypothetical protein ACI95C_001705 [Pseudohongiellaceae bacterium]|jgi:hypothetical protein
MNRKQYQLTKGPNVSTDTAKESVTAYVPAGMPPLDLDGEATSFFEFWPTWLMYLPVVLQWVVLSIRYRSLSLPLLANPAVPLSGMVGVAKSTVFDGAGSYARQWILPWALYEVSATCALQQRDAIFACLQQAGLSLPVVGKPNIGCRGAGVKLLSTEAELLAYVEDFPVSGSVQFQKLSQWDAEAGVFYVRDPESGRGEVTSLTLKYTPYVVGDGISTLSELVSADPRAGDLKHLYKQRHQTSWDRVLPCGEPFRLVFSASHCRGAIFRDAQPLINIKLTQSLDRIFDDIPEFYYGRLDIKFRNSAALSNGEDFEIIEINGASSESINIWDRRAKFGDAIKTLLHQYGTLFKLGAQNRARGYKPPGMLALLKAWCFENKLVKQYPEND